MANYLIRNVNNNYKIFLIGMTTLILILLNTGCSSSNEQPQALYGTVDPHRGAKYNLQLGLGYLEQGDVERAKGKFLKALQLAPELPEVQYNLAHFYYLIDEFKSADEHFNQAIDLASGNSQGVLGTAHNNYGVFLCQIKDYKAADQHFKLAINDINYADSASAYENAGLCALKNNNHAYAKSYFESAIKKNPLSPKALLEISELNIQDKELDKAKTYLDRYHQLNNGNKRSMLLSLRLAKLQNNKEKVNEITEKLLNQYPDSKKWLNDSQNYSQLNKSDYNNKLVKYTEIGKLKTIT